MRFFCFMLNHPTETGLRLFENPTFGRVRVINSSDDPLFCLADICKAVELTNPSSVKQRLDKEDVQLIDLHALNPDAYLEGNSMATFVNESAFYEVLLASSSPKVKPFRKWITHDILPSIRKTGGYIQTTSEDSDSDIMAKALMIAQKTIERREQQVQMLQLENSHLKDENKQLAPAAQYTEDVLLAKECMTFTQAAKALNFKSAQALIKRLISDKVIYKQSGQYLPASRYSGKGYTATRVARFFHRDGTPGTTSSTVWTQAGMQFLHSKYNA